MSRTCSVSGCASLTNGYSPLCNRHKKNKNRWGDAQQRPMTRGEIGRITRHCQKLIADAPKAPAAWSSFEAIRHAMFRDARDSVHALRDVPVRRLEGKALVAQIVADVFGQKEGAAAEEAMVQVIALAYLAEASPSRFRSDNALFCTVARRFRSWAKSHFQTATTTGKATRHRVMYDIPQRDSVYLGQVLMKTFGPFGRLLYEREQDRLQGAEKRKIAAIQAIAGDYTL